MMSTSRTWTRRSRPSWLTSKVVSLEVRMPDGTGCITFKSGFHMMVKDDLREYFSQLMITDVPRESFATTTSA